MELVAASEADTTHSTKLRRSGARSSTRLADQHHHLHCEKYRFPVSDDSADAGEAKYTCSDNPIVVITWGLGEMHVQINTSRKMSSLSHI